tara:strand:- start:40 stop:408 length:369 start_codon:yes stop_codon:yes gene_type:complete
MTSLTPPTVIQNWVRSIGTATPNQMTKFYSNDAILLATFATMLRGKREIHSYFVDFLDKKNMSCRILKNFTQNCTGGCQIASGLYGFTFDDENGRQSVIARYSYVVSNGIIINHHSSEDPDV